MWDGLGDTGGCTANQRPAGPDEISAAMGCDCFQVATVMREGRALPDHVGAWSVEFSRVLWVADCAPAPTLRSGEEDDPLVYLPVGDGRFTEAVNRSTAGPPLPLHESDHAVCLVVRQWVEDPPDEQFGTLLAGVTAWTAAVSETQASFRKWREIGERLNLRASRPDFAWPKARKRLARLGLPATPGTTDYLLHVAAPEDYPEPVAGPTRGVLVTSLGLIPRATGSPVDHGEMVSQVVSVTPWTTDALRRRAGKRVTEHAEWWKRLTAARLPDADLRRLNHRPADEVAMWVDLYLAGHLALEEVQARAVALEEQELTRRLSPGEKQQVKRRVAERVRYRHEQMERFLSG